MRWRESFRPAMDSNHDGNSDIRTLEKKLDRLVGLFFVLVGVLLIALAAGCLQVAWMIPRFERVFAEMLGDKPLPLMTQWVIGLGRLGDGFVLAGILIVLLVPAFILLVNRRNDPVAWITAVVTVAILATWALLAVASLTLPMISVITELNHQ